MTKNSLSILLLNISIGSVEGYTHLFFFGSRDLTKNKTAGSLVADLFFSSRLLLLRFLLERKKNCRDRSSVKKSEEDFFETSRLTMNID